MGRKNDNKIRAKLIRTIATQCMSCDNLSNCDYMPDWCMETDYYKIFDKSLNLKNARTYPGSTSSSSFNRS